VSAGTAWLDQARASATRLRRQFDGRAQRERVLLIGVAVAVLWMAADRLWLTPAFKDWSAARSRQLAANASLQRLNEDIVARGSDSRAAQEQLRRDIAQSRERVGQGDAALRSFGATLIGASDMVPMLDRLLSQSGGLRMRSVQSLSRAEVGSAPVAGAASAPLPAAPTSVALYRHGVELNVEGSYADVVNYVRAIEAMPQHVLWGGMQLQVEQFPKVLVTLRLYTLSPDRAWLEI
jgi:MSHA biogenesis protein MshJ